MIDYTGRIARLMEEIVSRVPALSFIKPREVLVFARFGRTAREGAFATCHCLNLPQSEPTHYYWRDRRTGQMTRRSEWFVLKSPTVRIGGEPVRHLVSFALPRFCDQRLEGSPKAPLYEGCEPWMGKLDTIVHELYHIDPREGIRRVERSDGGTSCRSHGRRFFADVRRMVDEFLASGPDPECYDFLRYDFRELAGRYGDVIGTTFRTFPSFPQRYVERLEDQPDEPLGIPVEPLKATRRPAVYTGRDLRHRRFLARSSRAWESRPAPRVRAGAGESPDQLQLSCW
jgi:hypothetical protein